MVENYLLGALFVLAVISLLSSSGHPQAAKVVSKASELKDPAEFALKSSSAVFDVYAHPSNAPNDSAAIADAGGVLIQGAVLSTVFGALGAAFRHNRTILSLKPVRHHVLCHILR